jgi:hypothetical protein
VLGDLEFAKRWVLESADERAAGLVLTAQVREWLCTAAPSEVQWRISGGRVSCTWDGRYDGEQLPALIDRVMMFVELVGVAHGGMNVRDRRALAPRSGDPQ